MAHDRPSPDSRTTSCTVTRRMKASWEARAVIMADSFIALRAPPRACRSFIGLLRPPRSSGSTVPSIRPPRTHSHSHSHARRVPDARLRARCQCPLSYCVIRYVYVHMATVTALRSRMLRVSLRLFKVCLALLPLSSSCVSALPSLKLTTLEKKEKNLTAPHRHADRSLLY
jgi:hypothetical protein